MQRWFAEWHLKSISAGGNLNKISIYFPPLLLVGFLFAKDSFKVTGVVQNADGDGVKKVELIILNSNDEEIADGKSKGGGKFKFKKIEPGIYTLMGNHEKEGSGKIQFTIVKNDTTVALTISKEPETIIPEDSIGSDDSAVIEETLLPQQKEEPAKELLKFEKTFFEYESNLKALKMEIDSLKTVVSGYEKKQTMPNLNRDMLSLIQVPEFKHRIELQNGTVVLGDILEESDSSLVLNTQIGKLVLKKQMVIRMDEFEKPGPKVIFLGEPFVDYYPDRQIFSGSVKNIGERRADFVRIIGKLWDQTTSNVGIDSVFAKGTRIVYNSNVIADTALEPGQSTTYVLTVPIKGKMAVQYHTMDIHWVETQ